jgi:hypothetical protein
LTLDRLMGVDGINMHKAMPRTTKTKPSGRRKRAEGPRREKMRRLFMIP